MSMLWKIQFLNKIGGFPYTLGAEETNIHVGNDFLKHDKNDYIYEKKENQAMI